MYIMISILKKISQSEPEEGPYLRADRQAGPGKFIALYGINNIGKSTHARLLVERLNKEGYKAKYLKYPVYDLEPTGPFINKILRNPRGQMIAEEELQLWFILNRYQFQPTLEKWLAEGYILVAEDYVGTGIAWGCAKGLDAEWLKEGNKFLLKEDFAILFEGKRDLRAQEKVHVHEQNLELVEKCRGHLEKLAEEYGWERLQVEEKIEDTAENVYKKIIAFLVCSNLTIRTAQEKFDA